MFWIAVLMSEATEVVPGTARLAMAGGGVGGTIADAGPSGELSTIGTVAAV